MTLNISSSNNLSPAYPIGDVNIRSGYENLKRKSQYNIVEKGLNVEFSTQVNTRATKLLAKDSVPSLLKQISADLRVHLLDSEKVRPLI
jgi:hypothetical protein